MGDARLELAGGGSVARDAECASVVEIAVAAFDEWNDVVDIPEDAALGESELGETPTTFGGPEPLQPAPESFGILAAVRADASVTLEDLVGQVAGARPESPLVYTAGRAEGPAPLGNLGAAASAASATIRTTLLSGRAGTPTVVEPEVAPHQRAGHLTHKSLTGHQEYLI